MSKKTQQFDITGMTCSACSSAIEKTVGDMPGVKDINVNLLTNSMVVDYEEDNLEENNIIEAVQGIGYGASVKGEEKTTREEAGTDKEYEDMKKRLIISLIFMIPLMYLTMGHMVGLPVPSFIVGVENAIVFALLQLFMTLPVVYVNRKFFINGFKSLWHKVPVMDSLIAIGSSAAIIYGAYALFKMAYAMGHGDMATVHEFVNDLYFESAAMILTLITLGKTLEARSKKKTSAAIEKLMDLKPKTAIIRRDGTEIEVPIEEVNIGDEVIVRPGSRIPVDGTVIEGISHIDESPLTGESMPVEKKEGSYVQTATMNQQGVLVVKAEKVGEDTTLAQIIKLVEDANATKAPIAKMADKISGVFVPVVIAIAVVVTIIWTIMTRDFEFALSLGIAVLVISCPCALGLATPVAIMVGTGKGAEYGILFKNAESLEVLHHVDTIVLDKTGTLTKGTPQVTDVVTLPTIEEEDILREVASLEQGSEHPLGQAIIRESQMRSLTLTKVTDFYAESGRGVKGDIDGHHYLVGNEAYMKENEIDTTIWDSAAVELAQQGKTSLYVARDGVQVALIAVADVLKDTSPQAVQRFREMGKEVWMITGDNKVTAKAVGKNLPLTHIEAQVLPQDKEQIVRKIQDDGKQVAMVGDGINDAPALVRADTGIAIGQGTDVAIESADVILMKDDLMDIANAISLSKATIKTIKQNLFWALFYNSLGIPIAAGIFYPIWGIKLSPMIAAAAMGLSSIFVVTNALRLRSFKPQKATDINVKAKDDEETEVESYQEKIEIPKDKTQEKETQDMEKTIKIEGMSCGHCSARVEKALNELDGVEAKVDLEKEIANVKADRVADEDLKKAVEEAGYEVVGIE